MSRTELGGSPAAAGSAAAAGAASAFAGGASAAIATAVDALLPGAAFPASAARARQQRSAAAASDAGRPCVLRLPSRARSPGDWIKFISCHQVGEESWESAAWGWCRSRNVGRAAGDPVQCSVWRVRWCGGCAVTAVQLHGLPFSEGDAAGARQNAARAAALPAAR
jgi:hypothetical protein